LEHPVVFPCNYHVPKIPKKKAASLIKGKKQAQENSSGMKHGVFLVIALLIASSVGAFIPGVASASPSVSLGLESTSG
jgi:MFS superfamily sulfate permease-like transporter